MSYYLNRSGYPLVLVLGTKCLVPFSAAYLPIAARSSGVKLVVYFLFVALSSALGARSIAFSTAWFTCWATFTGSPPCSGVGSPVDRLQVVEKAHGSDGVLWSSGANEKTAGELLIR